MTRLPRRLRSGVIAGRSIPNHGMHPTRDTLPVIFSKWAGGRLMPGVRRLLIGRKRFAGEGFKHHRRLT